MPPQTHTINFVYTCIDVRAIDLLSVVKEKPPIYAQTKYEINAPSTHTHTWGEGNNNTQRHITHRGLLRGVDRYIQIINSLIIESVQINLRAPNQLVAACFSVNSAAGYKLRLFRGHVDTTQSFWLNLLNLTPNEMDKTTRLGALHIQWHFCIHLHG